MLGLRTPGVPALDASVDSNRRATELHVVVDFVAEADENLLTITTLSGTRTVLVTGSRATLTGLQPNLPHTLRSVARAAAMPEAISSGVELWTRPSDLAGELTANPMVGGACLVSWRLESPNSDNTAPIALDIDALLPDGSTVAFSRGSGLEGAMSGAFPQGTVLTCKGYSLNGAGVRNETEQLMRAQVHGAAVVALVVDPAGQIGGALHAGRWPPGMEVGALRTGGAGL